MLSGCCRDVGERNRGNDSAASGVKLEVPEVQVRFTEKWCFLQKCGTKVVSKAGHWGGVVIAKQFPVLDSQFSEETKPRSLGYAPAASRGRRDDKALLVRALRFASSLRDLVHFVCFPSRGTPRKRFNFSFTLDLPRGNLRCLFVASSIAHKPCRFVQQPAHYLGG